MTYESVLTEIGGCGRWQRLSALLLWMGAFYTGMAFLIYPFAFATPERYRCNVPQCDDSWRPKLDEQWVKRAIPTEASGGFASCERYSDFGSSRELRPVYSDLDIVRCSAYTFSYLPEEEENQNSSRPVEECLDGYVFDDSTYKSTLVTEYDLVCSRNHLKSAVGMVNVLIYGLGSMLSGVMSDWLGRKPALLISIFLGCSLNFASSFSTTFAIHAALYVLAGLWVNGTYQPSLTLSVELVSKEFAAAMSIAVNFPFVAGELFMVLAAYLFRDFRDMLRFAAGSAYLLLLIGFFIPESPRWLIAKKKYAKAASMVAKGSRLNGRPMEKEAVLQMLREGSELHQHENKDSIVEETDISMLDVIKNPCLRRRLLILAVNWIACVLCFNGLSFNAVNLGSDVYASISLSVLIEIPSYAICFFVFDKFGRRPTLVWSQFLVWFPCLLAVVAPYASLHHDWFPVAMATIAKFGCTVAYTVVFLMSVELFPTSVRTKAIGTCSLASRVGGILAPFVTNLGPGLGWVPWVVFCTSCLLAMLAGLRLPETAGTELPMTIADAEEAEERFWRNRKTEGGFFWRNKSGEAGGGQTAI